MYDRGSGPPVIVIPGVQGRWEWMRPALNALSARCRTISYSLAGDFGSGMKFDAAAGFDTFPRQLDAVMARAGVERAAICGVSYGGFVALRYAATRPDRVTSLLLASSPAPGWVPNETQRRYLAKPWRSAPAFVVAGPKRLGAETFAAIDGWGPRFAFWIRQLLRIAAAPSIPSLMAARVALQQRTDFAPDCAKVVAPTLVISGEPDLDRIVPVEVTRRYCTLIRGARYEMMERTGHIGLVTRPQRFSSIVSEFVHAHDH